MTETNIFKLAQPDGFTDLLTEVLRTGARSLLVQAVEAEVADFLGQHADKFTEDGRHQVVRHGHLPEREIMTGIGAVAVRQPRVRDRGTPDGERVRFTPSILPPYARRSRSLEILLADNGYFSDANVTLCAAARIEPLIAAGRRPHHPSLRERFAEAPPAPHNPTPLQAMAHRLQTPDGKRLYALRKQTPEPVFGIIKSVMGFRQFLLRGLDNGEGEWSLVTMAWNIKRMFALSNG